MLVCSLSGVLLFALSLTIDSKPTEDGEDSNVATTYIQKLPSDIGYYFQMPTNPLQFSKCFPDLGCFRTNDYFDLYYRPFTLVPNDRQHINVTFCLYTKFTSRVQDYCPHHIRINDSRSVSESEFQAKRKTVVIIHGFIDHGLLPWVMLMKHRLLKLDDFNVIVLDWSGGNKFPYTQAAANTWVVGGELYLLLSYLESNFNLDLKDVHIVGHSLGSHIAGYTGARCKGKIGRISGLDPAGPFFEHLPASVRLDPTDAVFVDVIHTDGKILLPRPTGYGTMEPFGHVDFYVNGGALQPGCKNIFKVAITAALISVVGTMQEARRHLVACSHAKAVQYFIDSLSPSCQFLSHECPSYQDYQRGKCASCGQDGVQCGRMGYFSYQSCWNHSLARSAKTSRQFYLTTGVEPSISVYHYVVHIQMENTKDQSDEDGTLYMAFSGTAAQLQEVQINAESATFKAGQNYSFVFQSPYLLGVIKEITLRWSSSSLMRFLVSHYIYVRRLQVEPMDIVNEEWRLGNVTEAYLKKGQSISSGSSVVINIP